MAKPVYELIAESLSRVEKTATNGILRSHNLTRVDRERLKKSGWLQPIIAGWYLLTSAQVESGESTAWHASFWDFIQQYLQEKFADNYCLSAESSLDIHTADSVIPAQIVVITKASGHYTLSLPHNTNLAIYQDLKKFPREVETKHRLQVMPLGLALCRVSKSFFQRQPLSAKIALRMLQDPSEVTRHLLQDGMVQVAGRLAGACSQIGKDDFSLNIIQTMKAGGFDVSEENPFADDQALKQINQAQRIYSPYQARISSLWEQMRDDVIKSFSNINPATEGIAALIQHIDAVYVNDAYNSLSIEGYKVTKSLIEKIKSGEWNSEYKATDLALKNALAAKGYYQSFQLVRESIKNLNTEKNVAKIVRADLPKWYQALFSPSVEAGLITPVHLAGYRNERVYIRNSQHVPPPKEAVLDCMDAFFTCLQNEENPVVRAVLGHFIFVFIHPYMDGNGRIGRLLMNVLWSAAGYPWTIVRLETRDKYMQALEAAFMQKNIQPFTIFLAEEMTIKW